MENVPSASISDNLLGLFGTAPLIGRQVNKREDIGDPYMRAVNVSYELWQRRWHGDPSLVGRHIEVNNIDVVVAGIMPRGFRIYMGPGTNISERIDIWAPGAPDLGTARTVPAVARLKPGVTVAAAQRAIDAFMPPFMAAHASSYRLGPVKLTLTRLDEDVVRDVKPALVALSGAVGFVLLIACANLTNLLLARACARSRELAVRRSIGASRARLVAQLTTESVVLGVIGAALGLLVAQWAIDGLLQVAPAAFPRREQIGIDSRRRRVRHRRVASEFAALRPGAGLTSHEGRPHRNAQAGPVIVSRRCRYSWGARRRTARAVARAAGRRRPDGARVRQPATGAGRLRSLARHDDERRVGPSACPLENSASRSSTSVADAVRAVPGVTQAGLGLPIPLSDFRLTQRYAATRTAPNRSPRASSRCPDSSRPEGRRPRRPVVCGDPTTRRAFQSS